MSRIKVNDIQNLVGTSAPTLDGKDVYLFTRNTGADVTINATGITATNVETALEEVQGNVGMVQGNVDTLDDEVVKLTGDQTIDDIKTFTESPIVPTPTTGTQAVNKEYVDNLDDEVVKLTGDQTIDGIKTFTESPIVPTPTTGTQAVNKEYVDNIVVSPDGSKNYSVAMAIVFGS